MVFLFCFLFCSAILKGEVKNNAEKKIKLSRKKPTLGRKNKKTRLDFFQAGRRRFNISVTLLNYCGGYPRARGVRKIEHGYPWGDEFPTWSFEVARCVFVYTYSRPSLPSRGGTYSELVCLGIYKFITIYIYSHICI